MKGKAQLFTSTLAFTFALIMLIALPTSALSQDSDNDGLTDYEEGIFATDPTNPDSDGDGYSDGREVAKIGIGADPLNSDVFVGISDAERSVLVDLYNSTNGDNWTNTVDGTDVWEVSDLGSDECSWYGVTCSGNHVTVIDLHSNSLMGTIPESLGDLGYIQHLLLSDNQLSGTIPTELESLANLTQCHLHNNQVSGTIPAELGSLANLTHCYLHKNQLSGPIPPELGNLPNLNTLQLNDNALSGPIPPQLGNLASLQSLVLSHNALSGPIPPQLGTLTGLHLLALGYNELSGPIPPELGSISSLGDLGLHNNQLSGGIPPQLSAGAGPGNLTSLWRLNLGGNQLSGPIPPELGSLSNLVYCYLNTNELSGTIPPELENLSNLKTFWAGANQLSGAIPPELGNLPNLLDLRLQGNQLSGAIPIQLQNLTNLLSLYLYNNQLSGSIPPELANLPKLDTLHLHSNSLSGPIPPELGNLSTIRGLVLAHNQLSGMIPPELGTLTNLILLGLHDNQLSGPIPAELGNLTNLWRLSLSGNKLSGEVPITFLNLTNLTDHESDFHCNAIYTSNADLRDFLNLKEKYGDNWEGSQTIAPSNFASGAITTTSVELTWSPIAYTGNSGGYEICYSTAPGGDYDMWQRFETTASKTVTSVNVTGLTPGTSYYFVLRSKTEPHALNQNTVYSEYTDEVQATTVSGDTDGDGIPDDSDNCPNDPNPGQGDGDGDGVGDTCDNCPVANTDQSNIDGDGLGDLCDDCPSDPLDNCDPNGSGAGEIDAETGGTVETSDENLNLDIPSGALVENTTISVTQIDKNADVDLLIGSSPGLGNAIAVYDLEPDGLTFSSPVTITVTADVTGYNENQRDRMGLYQWDEAEQAFVVVQNAQCGVVQDPPGTFIKTCTAMLEHFSIYALVAPLDTDNDGVPDLFGCEEDHCPTVPAQQSVLMDYNGDYLLSIDETGTTTANVLVVTTDQGGQPLVAIPMSFSIIDSNENATDGCLAVTNEFGVASCNISDLPPDVYMVLAESPEVGCPSASTETLLVVFDPNVPRATGGGFILPDEESTLPASSDNDKANFGFIVKLDKNQAAAGNLEFQYKTADINLKSQDMTWYTVSNNKAMFQGEATINGEGVYTFRANATDGDLTGDQPDAFDIKIWAGTDTEADPYHRAKNDLAGGSIVIHKK